jgi:uncharacterized membrane protein
MIEFATFAQYAARVLDIIGIIIILGGALLATGVVLLKLFERKDVHHLYSVYRRNLARSILIGLEFLVAGDIIRSVGGQLSLDSVLILAVIVVIRSFLGIEFEMEIDGRWPWQRGKKKEQV